MLIAVEPLEATFPFQLCGRDNLKICWKPERIPHAGWIDNMISVQTACGMQSQISSLPVIGGPHGPPIAIPNALKK